MAGLFVGLSACGECQETYLQNILLSHACMGPPGQSPGNILLELLQLHTISLLLPLLSLSLSSSSPAALRKCRQMCRRDACFQGKASFQVLLTSSSSQNCAPSGGCSAQSSSAKGALLKAKAWLLARAMDEAGTAGEAMLQLRALSWAVLVEPRERGEETDGAGSCVGKRVGGWPAEWALPLPPPLSGPLAAAPPDAAVKVPPARLPAPMRAPSFGDLTVAWMVVDPVPGGVSWGAPGLAARVRLAGGGCEGWAVCAVVGVGCCCSGGCDGSCGCCCDGGWAVEEGAAAGASSSLGLGGGG